MLCRFSFEHGPIHYIHTSTEHYFHRGSEQHHFVKHALAAVDRRRTPWLIVTGHRPIYVDSTEADEPNGDLFVAAALREAFEELYKEYAVDLTLHGHHHDYQRTCPIYKGECVGYHDDGTAKGTVHLVIGNAGASLSSNQHEHTPEVRSCHSCGATRLRQNAKLCQGLLCSTRCRVPAAGGCSANQLGSATGVRVCGGANSAC